MNNQVNKRTGVSPLLSPYNNDENNTDIEKVAKIDDELSDIAKVIAHRFKGAKKSLSNLELQLVWDDDPNPHWFIFLHIFFGGQVSLHYFTCTHYYKFRNN